MTLQQLIDHLNTLLDKHGDVWVENDKGVVLDEDDIAVSRVTPNLRVVVIGKAR